jgi:hypothetical protein
VARRRTAREGTQRHHLAGYSIVGTLNPADHAGVAAVRPDLEPLSTPSLAASGEPP